MYCRERFSLLFYFVIVDSYHFMSIEEFFYHVTHSLLSVICVVASSFSEILHKKYKELTYYTMLCTILPQLFIHRVLGPHLTYPQKSPPMGHAFFDAKQHGEQRLLKSFCSEWVELYTVFEKKLFSY